MRAPLIIALSLIAGSAAVRAAPPLDHPGAEKAIDALGIRDSGAPATALPHGGIVISSTDANSFTYLEVRDDETGKPRWLAVPRHTFKPGDRVRFDEGGLMTNFFSRKLNVTFESILFVKRIVVVND
jgi:hypothetical protein